MTIDCTRCGTPLPTAEDGSPVPGVACETCGKGPGVDPSLRTAAGETATPDYLRDLEMIEHEAPPTRVEVRPAGYRGVTLHRAPETSGVTMRWPWRVGRGLDVVVTFVVLFFGGMGFLSSPQFGSPGYAPLASTACLLIVAAFAWVAVWGTNTMEITLDARGLSVRHRPFVWFGVSSIPVAQIERIVLRDVHSPWKHRGLFLLGHVLDVRLRNGRAVPLTIRLPPTGVAAFIQGKLEARFAAARDLAKRASEPVVGGG